MQLRPFDFFNHASNFPYAIIIRVHIHIQAFIHIQNKLHSHMNIHRKVSHNIDLKIYRTNKIKYEINYLWNYLMYKPNLKLI
jgi:hypothetical protein